MRKSSIFNPLLLSAALGILGNEGAAAAVEPESAKQAPPQIKLIADKAKTLSGYYSTAKNVFDVANALGAALGLIETSDADAKFNAIHDQLITLATGISWQATKNFIDSQRGKATRAIRNLKRDGTAMRDSNGDQDSGNAAETLVLGGAAFYRPYNEKVDGQLEADLLPQPGNYIYDWRLGIPALLEVISYRLQFIAAMDPDFRNDNLYDEELENYRSSLKWHLDTMLKGIKCEKYQPGKTALPAYYAGCSDIRTGIRAVDPHTDQPKPTLEAILASLRSDVMRAMPLFEVRAMIDTLYLYQQPWRDLSDQYQQIPVYRAPQLCLDVQWGDLAAGTPVWLWNCDGGDAQRWVYDRKSGRISNPPSGKCLDVQWASAVAGTPVWIWDCNGGDAQRWTYDHQTHVLENALGTVLDIYYRSNPQAGIIPVWTWPRNESVAQEWLADQEPPRRAPVIVQP
ncbi:MAG: RICIN domain-containing protein [Gammaproteobacteria bacterium]